MPHQAGQYASSGWSTCPIRHASVPQQVGQPTFSWCHFLVVIRRLRLFCDTDLVMPVNRHHACKPAPCLKTGTVPVNRHHAGKPARCWCQILVVKFFTTFYLTPFSVSVRDQNLSKFIHSYRHLPMSGLMLLLQSVLLSSIVTMSILLLMSPNIT